MNAVAPPDPQRGEITVAEIGRVAWRWRRTVLAVTVLCTAVAAVLAWIAPRTYTASILISPIATAAGGHTGGLSGLTSQLGGLAALAGLPVGTDSKKAESVAVLQSEALTDKFIEQNRLLPVLFWKKWDSGNQRWKIGESAKIPTPWQANRYFKDSIRRVVTDAKTGLVTLSIYWRNPNEAANWANELVKMTNDYLRNRAISEAEHDIAYLNDQASKTTVVEARQAIYSLLETEINQVMLARGSEEYAFKIIDPAVPAERPSSPIQAAWIAVGFGIGLLLSFLVAFALDNRAR